MVCIFYIYFIVICMIFKEGEKPEWEFSQCIGRHDQVKEQSNNSTCPDLLLSSVTSSKYTRLKQLSDTSCKEVMRSDSIVIDGELWNVVKKLHIRSIFLKKNVPNQHLLIFFYKLFIFGSILLIIKVLPSRFCLFSRL